MKITLATIACLTYSCLTICARIGETTQECDTRYGLPEVSGDRRVYKKTKSTVFIAVRITDGRCSKISYIFPKDAPRVRNKETTLYPLVVTNLLNINGKDERWVQVDFKNYTGATKYISLDTGKYAYFIEEMVVFFDAQQAKRDEKIDRGTQYTKGL